MCVNGLRILEPECAYFCVVVDLVRDVLGVGIRDPPAAPGPLPVLSLVPAPLEGGLLLLLSAGVTADPFPFLLGARVGVLG